MTFVSLFAGVGGIDLGLERAGMRCVGQVEIDEYATRVLERHWPSTPRIRDVRDFHGTEFGPFDLLTGGYPCQPFSLAGARLGESDERHLWPEVLRIIRNVRPRLVLLENVPGHLSLGFGRVLGDLAESGYDAEWDCIPAATVGAPHRRDRLWIVAYPDHSRSGLGRAESAGWPFVVGGGSLAYPDQQRPHLGAAAYDGQSVRHIVGNGAEPQSRRHELEPGTARFGRWEPEPDVGRVAHGIPNRVDRLRTLGNAVVPQVAEHIGRRLMEVFA